MKIVFSLMRIVSLVAALHIIPEGDLAVMMVALVWGITAAIEE